MKKFVIYLCLFSVSCFTAWIIKNQPNKTILVEEKEKTDRKSQSVKENRLTTPERSGVKPNTGNKREEPTITDLPQLHISEEKEHTNKIPLRTPSVTPYSKSAHARIIKEITQEVLDTKNLRPSVNTNIKQRVSLHKTSFKYPYLIVEESVKIDKTGEETVETAQALVADHLLVNLISGVDMEMAKVSLNDLNCSLGEKISEGVYLVNIKGEPSIEGHFEKRDLLGKIDEVIEIVEPDYFVTIVKTPNDNQFSKLWGIHNTGQTGGSNDKDIDGPEAWNISTGSKNVLGAVIDTGIDRNHEDLKANMWTNPGEIAGNGKDDDGNGYIDDIHGWDFANNDNNPFDDNSHGTHCAGTIGGVGNNKKGVAGVAWNISMVGIKFLSGSGGGATSDAIKSVAYATKIGVDFTSNSWGGGGSSTSLKKAIEEAGKKGIGFIAAAGNHSGNNDKNPSYPASYELDNVIAVGAHGNTGTKASFSCYGKKSVDLFAPGVNTYSTVPGNKYASYSGTSMATPHVAGAYALIQSKHPNWTCKQIKETLMNSTDPETSLKEKCVTGGRLNAFQSLQAEPAKERLIVAKPERLDFGKLPKNRSRTMEITFSNSGSEDTTISKADITGSTAYQLSMQTPQKIKAGMQISTTITFTSAKEGKSEAELIIESDAKNDPMLAIPLSAEVTATPALVVNPESLHFDLKENETKTQALTLSNKGDGELNYQIHFPNNQDWLASPFKPTSKQLKTSFRGGNGQKGNYIQVNIAAPVGISVNSLTGYFTNSGEVKVWTRRGLITDAVKSPQGWKEVASARVSTNGLQSKTFITDFHLPQGKHTLLFVNSGSVKYTNASFGSIAASDENLSILVGYGTARTSPSGKENLFSGRKWNGTIHYSTSSKEQKGTLAAGKSIELKAIAEANKMPSEYEEAYLLIGSNDPDEPEKKIKVTAQKLSENAGLVFRPSSLSFENTYVGQTAEKSLILSNASTEELTINQFAFRNSVFSHRLSLPITLKAGEMRNETIYFTPKSFGKIESSALVLTNEDGGKTRTLDISGKGSLAPVMAVTPSSLSATLKSKQEKTFNLKISNTGGSPLNWTLKGATSGGGKSLSSPIFAQSHFTPMGKGIFDNRKGTPVSILGGGPDTHGYNWTDSQDRAGPSHEWRDISKTGIRLEKSSGKDDAFDKVALPFSMKLYGEVFNVAFISSNGYLTFGKGSSEHSHFPLPTTMMAGNLIAPFAMDLDPSRSGDVYVQGTADEMLVQWNRVKDFAGIGEYTFQASLNRNGVIYFHYGKMNGTINRATTGIQNGATDKGLLVAYNNQQVKPDSTIRISTSPKWLHVKTTSGIIEGGKSLNVPVTLKSGSILAGNYKASIEISGNDPKKPATEVPISLTILPTRTLSVNPTSLNFGQVMVGSTGEKTIQVTNTGNAAVKMGNFKIGNNAFQASTASIDLNPGDTSSITLRFTPANGTTYESSCQVFSNAENSPISIRLKGKGLETPRFSFEPGSVSITLPAGQKTTSLASLLNTGKADGNFALKEVRNENSTKNAIGVAKPNSEQADPFAPNHVPNRLIIRYKDGQSGLANFGILENKVKVVRELAKARKTGNGTRALKGLNLVLVETVQNSNLRDVANTLSQDPAVEYVEPDYIRGASVVPNDPEWTKQYALQKIQAPKAWEKTKGSHSVIVAVIDTGIDYNHKDLQGNIWKNPGEIANNRKDDDGNGYIDDVYGWDFVNNDNNPMDGNRHGTHVAGTIAAASDNDLQVAGVAWKTKLVALKFLSDQGWGSVSDAIDAVAYCTAMDFPISNNSWGGGGSSKAMKEAIDRAGQNGHLFCAAAGNSGTNNDSKPHYPSSYTSPNILAVAASDSADRLASFSCYGKTSVDLAAPGVSILNLVPNNRVAKLSGTSMATPHVAGAAALVLSLNPNASFTELKQALMNSVDPINSYQGKMVAPGRLNLLKALEGYSSGWLSVEPEKGSVSAGKSSDLTFSIDASELNAGTKRAVVCFETNDPLAKILEIAVEVTIMGEPEIETDKKSLDFGELWVGNQKELKLSISNSGTDELRISQLSLGHQDLKAGRSSFSIKPGEKEVVTIMATPKSSGTVSTSLTITSNAKNTSNLKIPVRIKAILPPSLRITPERLLVTLEPEQLTNETLNFINDGEADGSWKADVIEIVNNQSRTRNIGEVIKALNRRKPEFVTPGAPIDGSMAFGIKTSSTGALRLSGGNPNSSLEVAVLGANTSLKNEDVAKGLVETKRFAGVTIINVMAITPSTKELEAFDSVIIYSNHKYANVKSLGDNLAEYADRGHGVVTMVFETDQFSSLEGRWKSGNYGVFSKTSKDSRNWSGLGEITTPNHPLMKEIKTFQGSYRLNKNGVAAGANLVAEWKDGLPLVAYRQDIANVVGLNFYPVSSRIPLQSKGWDVRTDGWKLMANALEWAAQGGSADWLKVEPLSGIVKGRKKEILNASFNSANLSEGNYSAELRVSSNDPVKPYQVVEIKLVVRKNRPPVANPAEIRLLEDGTKAFRLEASDPEGDPISFILTSQPKNGKLSGKAPSLNYHPNPNFNGTDEFSFKVSDGSRESAAVKVQLEVSAVNDAPWAKSANLSSLEDEIVVLGLQLGDPDGDKLQLDFTQKPENGFVIEDNGDWVYIPNPHFNGRDLIKFRAFDGKLVSNEATLTIDVKASNDAPIASNSKVTAQEGKRISFELVASDVDGDPMTYKLITAPEHGKIESSKDKKWAYTPNSGYNGTDSLTFRVSDGQVQGNIAQVSFDITERNDAPVVASSTFALLEDGELKVKLIASDPEGDKLTYKVTASSTKGSLTGNGPTYTYKPEANFNGTDTFTVVANDGQSNSQPAVVTLVVTSQNDVPKLTTGVGILSASYRETIFRIKLEGEDPDGDELTYSLTQRPVNGTCSINGDQLVYMPNPGFTGTEEIEVQVSDGKLSDVGTLVLPVEEHPNSIGLFVDLDHSQMASDFLYKLYEMNERLQKTGKYMLKLDHKKMGNGFAGSISSEAPGIDAITLNQWKDQIQSFDPMTAFSFHAQAKGGETSWHVTSLLEYTSGTDKDLTDKDKSKVENNKEEQKDPGESPDSPDPSSAPTEIPVLTISDLSRVSAIENAPKWYSLSGLGNFFDAGNDWIYQPEMGWCLAKVNQSDLSIWVFNEKFGWMWFPTELPNVTYMIGELANGWTYFPKSSVAEAGLLYDYANESWIKLK